MHEGESKVLETRRYEGKIYRKRECADCGHKFITIEMRLSENKMPAGMQAGRHKPSYIGPTWARLGVSVKGRR